ADIRLRCPARHHARLSQHAADDRLRTRKLSPLAARRADGGRIRRGVHLYRGRRRVARRAPPHQRPPPPPPRTRHELLRLLLLRRTRRRPASPGAAIRQICEQAETRPVGRVLLKTYERRRKPDR